MHERSIMDAVWFPLVRIGFFRNKIRAPCADASKSFWGANLDRVRGEMKYGGDTTKTGGSNSFWKFCWIYVGSAAWAVYNMGNSRVLRVSRVMGVFGNDLPAAKESIHNTC